MTRRNEFEERGYVAVPDFLDAEELARVNAQVDRFLAEVVPALPRELVYYEDRSDPRTLKQIQQMFEHDAFFAELMLGSRFQEFASDLLGEAVIGKNMQFFDKPARVGRATPPHQDGYYFMLEPCHAVTMWLALEDVAEEQGCVRYVTASHRRGLRAHGASDVLGFSQHILDFGDATDVANEVACPCRAGVLLAHHPMTIHAANANTTDRSRRALGFIYYGESAREDVVAQAAYQRQLAARLAHENRI